MHFLDHLAMVIGGAIGVRLALKGREMTEMPELVAVLHSFVGMAAVLVGFNSFIDLHPLAEVRRLRWLPTWMRPWRRRGRRSSGRPASPRSAPVGAMLNIHLVEVFLGVFIGCRDLHRFPWWHSASCVA